MIKPVFEDLKEWIEIEDHGGVWAKVTALVPSGANEVWQAQQPIICCHYQVWIRGTELLDHLPCIRFKGRSHRIISAPSLMDGYTYFIMREVKE